MSIPGVTAAAPALPTLSVVIPLYNESASLQTLHARLSAVLAALPLAAAQIVFVDDGSRDDTFDQVIGLHLADPRIKALRFARNFGKEAAMAAGLRIADGDAVVLMDGDLQHPPELIGRMLELWQQGAQMVTAIRASRETDPWLRRQLSRAFYRLFGSVAEIELTEGGGDFRLFDRRVVAAINGLPERTRFMKGITSWVGFRQAKLEFEVAERAAGQSTWSFLRLLSYGLDGLTAFSTFPLRMWSVLGILIATISVLYGGWLVLDVLIRGIDVPGYASLMVGMLFLSGIQLISLGVMGEYLGRVFTEVKGRPLYLVADELGLPPSDPTPRRRSEDAP